MPALRNKKTGVQIVVSTACWQQMGNNHLRNRFTLLDEVAQPETDISPEAMVIPAAYLTAPPTKKRKRKLRKNNNPI